MRSAAVSLIALLTACNTGPDSAAPAEPAPSDDADWWGVVGPRIAAEGRAIRATDTGHALGLPLVGAAVRFDAHGAAVHDGDETLLALRTRSVGRAGAPTLVQPTAPALGDCTDEDDVLGACVQRLEWDRGDAQEWWVGRDTGMQQGWTLSQRPTGPGPLRVEVEVEGEVQVDPLDDTALLWDARGEPWRVGGLAAWDATGMALPLDLRAAEGGLAIEVDDTGAVYPVTIDPIYESAATTLLGYVHRMGTSATGGDFNGDGYDDLATGAPNAGHQQGAVYVFEGSSTGLPTTPARRLLGDAPGDAIGAVLDGGGDLDGDGLNDLVVGTTREGGVRVYYGTAGGLPDTPDTTIVAPDSDDDYFGAAVASSSDVDGDGYDDILIGAYAADDASGTRDVGRSYIVMGSASGVSSTPTLHAEGSTAYERVGQDLAGGGDIDGDGYEDIVMGANTGEVWVYHGAASGLASTPTVTFGGSTSSFGGALAFAGDVDNDGYDDVLIGDTETSTATGSAFVHHGSATGLLTTATTTITGSTSYTRLGSAVSPAGDVNGDGYDDVLVGAYHYSSYTGAAYVYRGSPAGVSPTAASTLSGSSSAYFGTAVTGGHDFDGDGDPDLAVGAPRYSDSRGLVRVYESDGAGTITHTLSLTGPAESSGFGRSLALIGDINGDGFGDAAVGAYTAQSSRGRVFVYLGTEDGLDWDAHFRADGAHSARLGYAVAGAGDVNGDGYDDMVVGAYYVRDAFLYYGSASGLSSASRTTMEPSSSSSSVSHYFGWSVDGAGDVDGDGYDDVIIGGYTYDNAWVFYGSATGVGSTEDLRLAGSSGSDFGWAVAGAGDLNGDGYDDIAIGAPSTSSSRGSVEVFHGSSAGIASTSSQTLQCPETSCSFGADMDGGDVDGDGYDDLLVGGPEADSGYGGAWVFYGSSTGLPWYHGDSVTGDQTGDHFGQRVALGDLDADGYADAVVSDYSAESNAGMVYAFTGGSSGLTTTAALDLTGGGSSAYLGYDVSSGEDVDGDGHDDLLVGATSAAHLYRGYQDDDGDGVGAADDCDDADASVGAATITAYPDDDGDGYGDASGQTRVCALGSGFVSDATDCDDADATAYPGAADTLADGVDSDCDGTETCYVDADDDGYRPDATSTVASTDGDCSDSGEALSSEPTGDCDDTDAGLNPAVAEVVADGIDQDCDGGDACYADADDDGYRPDASSTVTSADGDCTDAGEAEATDPTGDCDDTDASVSPLASELPGDEVDQDCDGAETCYADADDDGYRPDATSTVASADLDCTDAGEALATDDTGDCDDADASFHPGASELPGDEVDQDCDGTETCYVDADDDGYRPDSGTTLASADTDCQDAGEATAADPAGDCDDTDAAYSPAATELPGDEVDQDCDGAETCYADADSDGYRGDAADTVESADTDCTDAGEALSSTPSEDCDDDDPDIHPGATEIPGDEVDQDCDGDELCFLDSDGDGVRPDETSTIESADLDCRDSGEAREDDNWGDCNDDDRDVRPGVDEIPGDGVDQNCNGTETCFEDADDDGWRPDEHGTVSSDDTDCDDAGEATDTDGIGDCDDADPGVNPDAEEIAEDGIDQDCDGTDAVDIAGGDTGEGEDEDDEADDEDEDDDGKSGCSTAPAAPLLSLAALALLPLVRRRRA